MNSFLQGKKVLSIAPLRPLVLPASLGATGTGSPSSGTSSPHVHGAQPTVEVVKEGDKIVRLVVICGCGERVEIECLYPAS